MKNKITILSLLFLALCSSSFAQSDKEDRLDRLAEKKEQNKDKVDYNLFHRQMLALKEYSEERRKIPALQKTNKGVVIKVVATVDSLNDGEDAKTLTGYITGIIGDNATNIYEVKYDRLLKKITSVKPTGETNDAVNEDAAPEKKTAPKKTIRKKNKDDDDDEDSEDEKPVRGKDKDDD